MNPTQLLLLAYLQAQREAQAQQSRGGGPSLGDLADLAKETGASSAVKDFFGLGGGGAATTAATYGGLPASAPVASHMGGTMLASGEVVPMSMAPLSEAATGITNFAGAATPALGVGATLLGGYNAVKGFQDKNPVRGGLGGAGAGLGLAMLGLGPVGLLAGGGALLGGGAALANKMGDKDRWKTEQKRLAKLREQGINIPQMEADRLTGGRSKQQLIDEELAKQSRGEYSNVDFARTRDEKYLKPEDIWGYATFAEKYGNDWFGKYDDKQRREIAQRALDSGAVREHHGTIDVDWGKVDAGAEGKPLSTPTTPPNRQTATPISRPIAEENKIPSSLRPISDAERGKYNIDPRDPNKYSVDKNGNVVGTLMGWSSGSNPQNVMAQGFNSEAAPKQSWNSFRGGNRIPRRS